jgi:hypothetical protein
MAEEEYGHFRLLKIRIQFPVKRRGHQLAAIGQAGRVSM